MPARLMVALKPDMSALITVFKSARAAMGPSNDKTNGKFNLAFRRGFAVDRRMNSKRLLGLFLRHALTSAGGYATGTGIVSESEFQTGTGAIIALVGIGLSIWDKKRRK